MAFEASGASMPVINVDVLDPSDALQGLTSQQEHFCQLYVQGAMTKTDAYRQAYNVGKKTKRETVNRTAHIISRYPKVQARIAQLASKQDIACSLDTVKLRKVAINVIVEIAEHGGDRVQLAAAIAIAKMPDVGLYKDTVSDDNEDLSGDQLQVKFMKIVESMKQRVASAHDSGAKKPVPIAAPSTGK